MSITRQTAIRVFVGAVLAAAYMGAVMPHRLVGLAVYDEGVILSGAVRIMHGQLPYRDFDSGYPPAQFYTIAGVFSIFGTSLLSERVWDTLWRLAIVGMSVLLAKAATPRLPSHPVPLICGCLLTGSIGFRLYPMIAATLPCLAAVWCAALYLQQRGARWLFFSGIAAGTAMLYRHDLAACVCLAITATTCYQAMTGPTRRWLRALMSFCGGTVLVVALPVLLLWLSVPHDALIRAFVDFPKITYAGRHTPMPGPVSSHAWLVFYFPLTVILVSALTFRRADPSRKPTLALLLMTDVLALALATQRLDIAHAYPALMFSMALLVATVATGKPGEWRVLRMLLLSATIFGYGLVSLIDWSRLVTEIWQASPSESAPDIDRAGSILLARDQRQAVRYIRRYLPAGKPLYVGAAIHEVAWYNDASFYFLADRPPATRFDMFAPGLTTSVAVQSEILRDIRRKQTEYVVLFRVPAWKEANLSSVMNGVHILDDAVREEYTLAAEFGRYTIWHRKNV